MVRGSEGAILCVNIEVNLGKYQPTCIEGVIYKLNQRLNRVNLKVTFAAYHDNSGAT